MGKTARELLNYARDLLRTRHESAMELYMLRREIAQLTRTRAMQERMLTVLRREVS